MIKIAAKWIGAAIGVLVVAGVALTAAGATLPVTHRATAVARIDASPPEVWETITDFPAAPQWRSDVERVEMISGRGQGTLFREHGAQGALTMRVEEMVPTARLVTRIADQDLPFGGTWTFEIEDAADGTSRVRITEDGQVHSAFFRGMSRWVFGYTGTLEGYLRDLARHHGDETVTIETEWRHGDGAS